MAQRIRTGDFAEQPAEAPRREKESALAQSLLGPWMQLLTAAQDNAWKCAEPAESAPALARPPAISAQAEGQGSKRLL
eukprot:4040503-Pyramimonas_sp.AAC.1